MLRGAELARRNGLPAWAVIVPRTAARPCAIVCAARGLEPPAPPGRPLSVRGAASGGGAGRRDLGRAGPRRGHRLSQPATAARAASQSALAERLCADQRDAAGDPGGGGNRAALRRRRRRHPPAERDRDRLPEGTIERNRDAYLLSPATLLDRSLGRRVRLRRTSRATGRSRAGGDRPLRRRRRGHRRDRRRLRIAALHRPARNARP